MPRNLLNNKGFTLIEILIYLAAFAIIAGALTTVLVISVNSEKRESASTEVNQELNLVLGTVQRLVSGSSLVEAVYEGTNPSSTCATFCTLKLRRLDPAKDPTIVSSDANGIYLKEGASATITLTANKVIVNSLKFTKYETPAAHAAVEINAALTYNSSNPRFAVTKSLASAIARVSAATFDSNLLPNQDNFFDIGQTNARWRSGIFSGNLGVGLTSPSAKLHVSSTSEQLRLGYDATNYTSFTTNSVGDLSITPSGGNVGIGTASPTSSAILELNSTNLGFLPPRMTQVQRDAIISPAAGLVIYNTTANAYNYYSGSAWTSLTGGGSVPLYQNSLPACQSSNNGQELYYIADSANGILWHLRCNYVSASNHYWEFLGGSPLIVLVDTEGHIISDSYTDLVNNTGGPSPGPSITVPLTGDYLLSYGAGIIVADLHIPGYMSPSFGGSIPSDNNAVLTGGWSTAHNYASLSRQKIFTGLTQNQVVRMKYRSNSESVNIWAINRWISILPVRVR